MISDRTFTGEFPRECFYLNCIFGRLVMGNESFKNHIFENCTFENVEFSEVDFSGTQFVSCKFLNCTATQVNFEDCKFSHCYINGFTITYSSMQSSKITSGWFNSIIFQFCNMKHMNISHSTFNKAKIFSPLAINEIDHSQFEDCEWSCSITGVNFYWTSISNSSFKYCILLRTNFFNTSLKYTDFLEAKFDACKFDSSTFRYIEFKNYLKFKNCTFSKFQSKATNYSTEINQALFYKSSFDESTFCEDRLNNVHFNECSFNKTIFKETSFDNACIELSLFECCEISNTCTAINTVFSQSNIVNCKIESNDINSIFGYSSESYNCNKYKKEFKKDRKDAVLNFARKFNNNWDIEESAELCSFFINNINNINLKQANKLILQFWGEYESN